MTTASGKGSSGGPGSKSALTPVSPSDWGKPPASAPTRYGRPADRTKSQAHRAVAQRAAQARRRRLVVLSVGAIGVTGLAFLLVPNDEDEATSGVASRNEAIDGVESSKGNEPSAPAQDVGLSDGGQDSDSSSQVGEAANPGDNTSDDTPAGAGETTAPGGPSGTEPSSGGGGDNSDQAPQLPRNPGDDCTKVTDDPIVYGTSGKDVICLGNGRHVVYALEGDDIVRGGSGDDAVYGGPGNDTLIGGGGEDALIGDEGQDRCSSVEPPDCEQSI